MSDIEALLRQVACNIDMDLSSGELMAAADEIERLRAENEKLCEALTDAAGELQHAYIMGFTERYRDAARAARAAVAAIKGTGDE